MSSRGHGMTMSRNVVFLFWESPNNVHHQTWESEILCEKSKRARLRFPSSSIPQDTLSFPDALPSGQRLTPHQYDVSGEACQETAFRSPPRETFRQWAIAPRAAKDNNAHCGSGCFPGKIIICDESPSRSRSQRIYAECS